MKGGKSRGINKKNLDRQSVSPARFARCHLTIFIYNFTGLNFQGFVQNMHPGGLGFQLCKNAFYAVAYSLSLCRGLGHKRMRIRGIRGWDTRGGAQNV